MRLAKFLAVIMFLTFAMSSCGNDNDVSNEEEENISEVIVTPSSENDGVLVGEGLVYKITSFTEKTCCVFGTSKEVDKFSYTGSFIIPSHINYNGKRYSVTLISPEAFKGFGKMSSVHIPYTICSIGEDAFAECRGLTVVEIDDLNAWCRIDFCGSIEYHVNYYTSTNSNPLCYAHHLNVKGKLLTHLDFPSGLSEIKDFAFCGCQDLISANIPEGITRIGAEAFRDCGELKTLELPNSITKIGYAAFRGCKGLTSLAIPSNVTEIVDWTFSGCSGLESLDVPNTVTEIGNNALSSCGFATFTIPNGIKAIRENTFNNCRNLENIRIPESVISIGGNAFYGCSKMEYIVIPSSVRSIGGSAITSSDNLMKIICKGNTPPKTDLSSLPFFSDEIVIMVPTSAVNEYKRTENWQWAYNKIIGGAEKFN